MGSDNCKVVSDDLRVPWGVFKVYRVHDVLGDLNRKYPSHLLGTLASHYKSSKVLLILSGLRVDISGGLYEKASIWSWAINSLF